jgi:hypothetical protein
LTLNPSAVLNPRRGSSFSVKCGKTKETYFFKSKRKEEWLSHIKNAINGSGEKN